MKDLEGRFEDLIRLYYRPVSYFFFRRGFTREQSLDLTQETFLRAHRGLRSFRGQSSDRIWLFTIAKNVWCNQVRLEQAAKRCKPEIGMDHVELSDQSMRPAGGIQHGGPLEEILTKEKSEILRSALESLPPQRRQCLTLRFYQDLRYHEIAEVMQLSINTVKAHLSQAKRQLKEVLGDHFTDEAI